MAKTVAVAGGNGIKPRRRDFKRREKPLILANVGAELIEIAEKLNAPII